MLDGKAAEYDLILIDTNQVVPRCIQDKPRSMEAHRSELERLMGRVEVALGFLQSDELVRVRDANMRRSDEPLKALYRECFDMILESATPRQWTGEACRRFLRVRECSTDPRVDYGPGDRPSSVDVSVIAAARDAGASGLRVGVYSLDANLNVLGRALPMLTGEDLEIAYRNSIRVPSVTRAPRELTRRAS